jgi:hypothetical protein
VESKVNGNYPKEAKMTGREIEALADEVLRDLRKEGRIFETHHVQKKAGVCAIEFSHGKSLLKVSIDLQTHNTDETIRQEIRRQLVEQSAEILPPSKRAV